MMLEPGTICVKLAGREAGKYCVIIEQPAQGFVLVTGPKAITGVKRRKCNIFHLEPTQHRLELAGSEDSDVEAVWKGSGLIEKLGIQLPERRRERKEKEAEKPAKKGFLRKKKEEKK